MTKHLKGKKPEKKKWEKLQSEQKDCGYTHLSEIGFYNSSRWRNVRNYVMANEPLCRHCLSMDKRVKAANVVDHIVPIDEFSSDDLRFGLDNLQPLCNYHHRLKTRDDRRLNEMRQKIEKGKADMDSLNSW